MGASDEEDLDDDGDGVLDVDDNCPSSPAAQGNQGLADVDKDGCIDSIEDFDNDLDSDGVPDHLDAFPLDPRMVYDTDGDGYGDSIDAFPYDESENADSDLDGVGDGVDQCPNGGVDDSGRIGCYGEPRVLREERGGRLPPRDHGAVDGRVAGSRAHQAEVSCFERGRVREK